MDDYEVFAIGVCLTFIGAAIGIRRARNQSPIKSKVRPALTAALLFLPILLLTVIIIASLTIDPSVQILALFVMGWTPFWLAGSLPGYVLASHPKLRPE